MKKILLIILFVFLTQNLFCYIEKQEHISSKKVKNLKLLSNVCRVRLTSGIGFLQQNNLFFKINSTQVSSLLKNHNTPSKKNILRKTAEQINTIKIAEEPLLRTYIIEYNDGKRIFRKLKLPSHTILTKYRIFLMTR